MRCDQMKPVYAASCGPAHTEDDDITTWVISADQWTSEHVFILFACVTCATDHWQHNWCDSESIRSQSASSDSIPNRRRMLTSQHSSQNAGCVWWQTCVKDNSDGTGTNVSRRTVWLSFVRTLKQSSQGTLIPFRFRHHGCSDQMAQEASKVLLCRQYRHLPKQFDVCLNAYSDF